MEHVTGRGCYIKAVAGGALFYLHGYELSNDTNVTPLRKVLKPDSLGFFYFMWLDLCH